MLIAWIVVVTILLTSANYAFLAWLAVRRVTEYLRDNPEGTHAITEHLLVPLLGRKRKEE